MAVTRERFDQGLTYAAFKAQMTRNYDRFIANEDQLVLTPENIAPFIALQHPLHVLVLAEDWCGDVIDNLPILGRLAAESGKLNLRIFLRDQNLDIMDQYLKQGEFRSIPVFVILDEQFNELGHFIERPATVTARRNEQRQTLSAQYPELGAADIPISQLSEAVRVQLMQAMAAGREATRATDAQDVIAAVTAIIVSAQA